MIIPPPEIRLVIEGVVHNVATHGKDHEARLINVERANPKYSFLNPNDPYHPYYATRLTGSTMDISVPDALASRQSNFKAPQTAFDPKIHFPHIIDRLPMSALDFEMIKLTALWAACNDSSFISTLVSRELRNSQYDFLKVGHSYHELYRNLVQSYEALLSSAEATHPCSLGDLLGQVSEYASNIRLEVGQPDSVEKPSATDDDVDWQSFVIGDVIEFVLDDPTLEPPLTLGHLTGCSVSERVRLYGKLLTDSTPQGTLIEMARPTEQFVVCPVCKGRVPASQYAEHVKLETVSSKSSDQRRLHAERLGIVGTETSTEHVLQNVDRMLSKRAAHSQQDIAKRIKE